MAYDRLSAQLDQQHAHEARTEELSYAYKRGERFEQYCEIMRANGDEDLIPHFLDAFIETVSIDWSDKELETNFEEGSPTAARVWASAERRAA